MKYNQISASKLKNNLLLALLFALLFSYNSIAQQDLFKEKYNLTYVFLVEPDAANYNNYTSALGNANFNDYRLRAERISIVFADGVVVELFSGQELVNSALFSQDLSFFPEEEKIKSPSTFKLTENLHIVELKQIYHPKELMVD